MTKETIVLQAKELLLKKNQHLIQRAIANGQLVIFPTETVYGIGANALNPEAAQRIYAAKGRPSDNPLIVHIADRLDVARYVTSITSDAQLLMDAFWPGPLTLILPKNDVVPLATTGGLQTVAIRMPRHPIAQKVIAMAGVPLAAPSANISGKPTSTLFQHVYDDFNGIVDIIIDGGPSEIGLESTVVDVTGEIPILLRPGYVTRYMMEQVLQKSIHDLSHTKPTGEVKSPGMKYTHYKPKADVWLIDGPIERMVEYYHTLTHQHPHQFIAVICESEYQSYFPHRVRPLGSLSNQNEIAHNLFSALRDMDAWGAELVLIHHLSDEGLGQAIMNRLVKAAGYHIIHV